MMMKTCDIFNFINQTKKLHTGGLPASKLTCPPKRDHFKKEISSLNHDFSGDMSHVVNYCVLSHVNKQHASHVSFCFFLSFFLSFFLFYLLYNIFQAWLFASNSHHQDYYIFPRDPYKPAFATVTGRGPHPMYIKLSSRDILGYSQAT